MKKILARIAVLSVSITLATHIVVRGEDYRATFLEHLQKNIDNKSVFDDGDELLKLLRTWEEHDSKDPELFVAYLNYYFRKSLKRDVIITKTPLKGEEIPAFLQKGNYTLVKRDVSQLTSRSEQQSESGVRYITEYLYYDKAEAQKGIDKINKGIEMYPDRLDMIFGKVYALGQLKDWEKFTAEIIRAVTRSSVNKNRWICKNGQKVKVGVGEKFFLTTIQDYQKQLYDTNEDDLLLNMREIAKITLKYYPNHVESLTDLAITYVLTGEYNKGLQLLLQAEKLNPEDSIVLSNLARVYTLKHDQKEATT